MIHAVLEEFDRALVRLVDRRRGRPVRCGRAGRGAAGRRPVGRDAARPPVLRGGAARRSRWTDTGSRDGRAARRLPGGPPGAGPPGPGLGRRRALGDPRRRRPVHGDPRRGPGRERRGADRPAARPVRPRSGRPRRRPGPTDVGAVRRRPRPAATRVGCCGPCATTPAGTQPSAAPGATPEVEVRGAPASPEVEVRGAPAFPEVEVRGAPATSHETSSAHTATPASRSSRTARWFRGSGAGASFAPRPPGAALNLRTPRRHLLGARQVPRAAVCVSAYWRRFMTDEAWRQVQRDFNAAMEADVA